MWYQGRLAIIRTDRELINRVVLFAREFIVTHSLYSCLIRKDSRIATIKCRNDETLLTLDEVISLSITVYDVVVSQPCKPTEVAKMLFMVWTYFMM